MLAEEALVCVPVYHKRNRMGLRSGLCAGHLSFSTLTLASHVFMDINLHIGENDWFLGGMGNCNATIYNDILYILGKTHRQYGCDSKVSTNVGPFQWRSMLFRKWPVFW